MIKRAEKRWCGNGQGRGELDKEWSRRENFRVKKNYDPKREKRRPVKLK